jgi:hypothetical protein
VADRQEVLYAVPEGYGLVEFRLQMPDCQGKSGKTTLTLGFVGGSGRIFLRFVGPHPFGDLFAVTDDAAGITVLNSRSDQWENKRVRLEFLTGQGQAVVIWAESVERIDQVRQVEAGCTFGSELDERSER